MQDAVSLFVPVYKPVGKTPLECVEEYKSKHLLDPSITVSYAGRLDPMAEGVLLLLVGDANKKRREYEHLSKEYEVTVLVGFATDTGDLMGKITEVQGTEYMVQSEKKLSFWSEAIESMRKILSSLRSSRMTMSSQVMKVLPSFVGMVEQKYPIYSSAKVRGKPLYWWARRGRLNEIEIPSHKVQIDSIEVVSEDTITNEALLIYIIESVGSVKGDFRQDEIIKQWKNLLSMSTSSLRERNEVNDEAIPSDSRARLPSFDYALDKLPRNDKNTDLQVIHPLFTLRITCGSGTYMRQLVADIGEKLGVPMCAYGIKRMKVGKYRLEDCVK